MIDWRLPFALAKTYVIITFQSTLRMKSTSQPTDKWSFQILGVHWTSALAFLGLWFFSSWIYRLTIWASYEGYNQPNNPFINWTAWMEHVGLHHVMMMVTVIAIWFILFRLLAHWALWKRLALHAVFLPIFLFVAHTVYYWACDLLGIWRFENSGQVWDIYIPMLQYFIQFGIFHAYEYYHISQKKLKQEMELKNAALKSELNAIKAQLNPHFLYNVFNTINASIPETQETTREMIADLADLFRYQLKASREDYVPLKDELQFVKQYLDLEKKRFEDRLSIEIDVPENLLDRPVPPMVLQPIVENALKHGIAPLVDGGKVTIKITDQDGNLHFEVADTGVGVEDTNNILNEGVGLSNTQLRLKKMYESQLHFMHNQPTGLIVRFAL